MDSMDLFSLHNDIKSDDQCVIIMHTICVHTIVHTIYLLIIYW